MKVTTTGLLFFVFIASFFNGLNVRAQTATVMTNKADYHPGETLVITGSGWLAGETVKLQLEETPALCVIGHDLYATADTNGKILNNQFVFKESHLGVSFLLTAIGESSGYQAETLFTDANFGSVTSGNWNDPATWGLTGAPVEGVNYPGSKDIVSIVGGHSVTLTQNHSSGTLMVSAGAIAGSVSQIKTQAFDLFVNGNLTISGNLVDKAAEVSIGTGRLNVSGNVAFVAATFINSRRIVFTGTGTLGVAGSLSADGIINCGAGTIEFNGLNPQLIRRYAYHNLTLVGNGAKTLHQALTLTGNLLVESGAVLSLGSTDLTIGGGRSVIINGRVNMENNGKLADGSSQNSFYINSGGYLSITGNLSGFPNFEGTINLDPNSTVEYGASNFQTVKTMLAYGNLILKGGNTKSLGAPTGTVTIRGSLTIDYSTVFVTHDNTVNLEGNLISRGTIQQGAGAFNLVGGEQTIGSSLVNTTFSHLKIAGSGNKTLAGPVFVNNSLTLTNNLINVGARMFWLVPQASIIGGGPSSYINGKITRGSNFTGPKFYPVGKGGIYSPVTINYVGVPRTNFVEVEVFESGFGGTLPSGITQLGSRFWEIKEAVNYPSTYEIILNGEGHTPTGPVVILKQNSPSTISIPAINTSTAEIQTGYKTSEILTTFGRFALGETNVASTTTVSNSTAIYGSNSVELTASVFPSGATGNVAFFVNDLSVGTAVVTSGSASLNYSLSHVAAGLYRLRAEYLGDGVYRPSLSEPNADVTLTIDQKPLVITATGIDKIYDGQPAATVILSDDRIAGDVLDTDYLAAWFEDRNIGTGKPVSVSGINITGEDASNYNFNTNAFTSADITARALVVSASGIDKSYNGQAVATVTLNDDRVPGDVFDTNYTAASFEDKNIGIDKLVTVSGINIAGVDALNYSSNTVASARASIDRRSINGAFTAANKVYDGTSTAIATSRMLYSVIPLDEVSMVGGTANFADKTVAEGKIVTLSGATLAGADAINYNLESMETALADITKLPVTGRFAALDKIYDGNASATVTSHSLIDYVSTDDVSLEGGTATFADKNSGTDKVVTLAGATLTGTDAGNYTLAGVTTTKNDISAMAISGTFTVDDKIYDGSASATVTSHSLIGHVSTDNVYLEGGTATFADKNRGTAKVVTLAGATLTGTDAGNYTLAGVTTTKNDISAMAISGTFTADDKIYDGNASATVTSHLLIGYVSTDDISLEGGTATFADKNRGTAKVVTLAGATLIGTDAGNYTLAGVATTKNDISPRPVTITAASKSKVYGDSDLLPFTYYISSGSLVSGENFTGTLSRVDGENVGRYAVQLGSVALTNNYALTYVPANLSITPRFVSIAADAKLKYCGQVDPDLTYLITAGNLANSDSFSGSLARDTGESSGTYALTQGTVALSDNYELYYTGSSLIITGTSIDASASSIPIQIGTLAATLKARVTSTGSPVTGIGVNFIVSDHAGAEVATGSGVSTGTDGQVTATINTSSLPAGVYTVTATAGSGCSSSIAYLSIYDPTGGFVTGGGWINSPLYAPYQYMQVEGKGNFGFNAKYKKGKTGVNEVDGNTTFHVNAGSIDFKSSSHEAMSLVISGSKATYKGEGTIKGSAKTYQFLVVVTDGDMKGKGNPDLFRIKIWEKGLPSVIVYDNQYDAFDNADPAGLATTLGGGSIVIHEVKGGKQSSNTPLADAGRGLDMKIVEPVFEQKIKLGAYPNPFGKQATIAFTLPADEHMVTLDMYDLKGSKVKRMYEGKADANQTLEFEFNGSSLSPGMYLLRLTTAKKVENFKMIMTE